MPEVRKHYFLDEYCIIATERARRPSDFVKERKTATPSKCPFCPGNEEMTPPATAAYKYIGDELMILSDGEQRVKGWVARCFPNLYPAVSPLRRGEVGNVFPAYGYHEVIVESPEHDKHPSDFSDEEARFMLRVYLDRVRDHWKRDGIRYVSLFRNYGQEAGASLSHPHSQMISIQFLPKNLEGELRSFGTHCPYCMIVEDEEKSERMIEKNPHWVAFAPFCSISPFEVWILPREHISSMLELGEDLADSLATILRNMLRRLKILLNDPPYNYAFFQERDPRYHINLRIRPKLATAAGFEMNTEVYINPVAPEDAARWLRG